jgi:hypothetical protein
MKLTGEQHRQLSEALDSAFPSKAALARMVRQQLNHKLDAIATAGNLLDLIDNLIEWAESQGKLFDLIGGAYRQNPGNRDLSEFYESYRSEFQRKSSEKPGIQSPSSGDTRFQTKTEEIVDSEKIIDEKKKNTQTIQHPKSSKGSIVNSIIGGVIGFILGILGNMVAAWLYDIMPLSPILIIILVLLIVIGIVFGALVEVNDDKKFDISKLSYWWITIAVSLVIILLGIIVILSGNFLKGPYTFYFVVDATDKMIPIFDDVQEQVQLAAVEVKDNSRIGLRVYGGDITQNSLACQDSKILMEIHNYPQAQSLLDNVLKGVEPGGHSSLTGAVLESLFSDIKEEKRPVKLVLITSGLDSLCDPPADDFLADRAKDFDNDIELLIISIGKQSENNTKIFESYAQAFNGAYLAIDNAEELPRVMVQLSFYGYGYPFYGNTP